MKSIYNAIIILVTMTIFSLAASAQTSNPIPNTMPNGVVSASTTNGTVNNASSLAAKGSTKKVKKNRTASSAADQNSSGQSQINHGFPGQGSGEIDRYGYQGTPLSSNSRPCLVSGARRCVQ